MYVLTRICWIDTKCKIIPCFQKGILISTVFPLDAVLAGFVCQFDTSWSYHRERSFSWGNASMRSSCKAFSQLVIKGEGSLVGGTIPGLVVLGSIREQAEQAMGKQASKEHLSMASASAPAS